MELDKHIDEVEKYRKELLSKFRFVVFDAEIARNDLPFFVHPLTFILYSIFIIPPIIIVLDFVGLLSYSEILGPVLLYGFYIFLFIFPLIYWIYGLYKTIKLTFYTDFLKKNILKDLHLLINYYSLILNFAEPNKKENPLKNGIEEMEKFGNSFSKPKLFRNLTLGSLSSLGGILGIITTIVTQDYPLIGQTPFEGYLIFEDLAIRGLVLALIAPWILVSTLVIIPLILGIRGSAIYVDKNFRGIKTHLRKAMRETIPTLYKLK